MDSLRFTFANTSGQYQTFKGKRELEFISILFHQYYEVKLRIFSN